MKLEEYIGTLSLGEPLLLGNLMVVPVEGALTGGGLEPLHLALEEGKARVKELGRVERILVENPSLEDLFVMEGEELLGARQDRMVVSSAVVPSRGEVELPVVCIEEGRWAGDDPLFRGGYVAHPRLRSMVTLSMRDTGKVDQRRVWKEVERKLTTLKVSSVTGSLHHSFTQREGILEELYGGWEPGEDVTGVMAFTPRGFLCCDLLAHPRLFSKEWPGMAKGYALDALEERLTGSGVGEWEDPREWWGRLGEASLGSGASPGGRGEVVFLEGDRIIGRALIAEEGLIHASIHPLG